MRIVLLLVVAILVSACDSPAPRAPSAPYRSLGSDSGYGESRTSLFTDDASVLSDQDIDRILRFKYATPRESHIAILALGRMFILGYSTELARSGEEIRKAFTDQLKSSPAVVRASYLPDLLVPQKRTVGYLREAATRFQADTLLVYQTECNEYQQSHLFFANEARAYCTIEAALVDVRTGILPFTTTATEVFTVKQAPEDTDIFETQQKAEMKAIRAALLRIAGDVVTYYSRGG
jgi:hypothetical protein